MIIPKILKKLLTAWLFVVICVPGVAATALGSNALQIFITPPQGEIVSGKPARFTLFFQNQTSEAITTQAYGRLAVTLTTPSEVQSVEAVALAPNQDLSIGVPAQGIARQDYEFLLPEALDGTVTMAIDITQAQPVMFAAVPPPIQERTEQIPLGKKNHEFQPFMDNFSSYEPMYFLFGVDPGLDKSKFQISFKYKLFNAPFESQKVNGFMDGFHLAYTQTSHWDLKNDSKPFDDTSYKPELFYLIPKIDLHTDWIKAFGIQTGFQHESNGKGGDDSRSTNFAYIEPTMGFSLGKDYFLAISPRIWAYVENDNDTNADLYKYRGYFNFQAKMGSLEGLVLDTNTRWAEKGPSFQADLSYPLSRLFKNKLNMYLHIQYFNGYAERLIEYQEQEEVIRVGFSFIR